MGGFWRNFDGETSEKLRRWVYMNFVPENSKSESKQRKPQAWYHGDDDHQLEVKKVSNKNSWFQ